MQPASPTQQQTVPAQSAARSNTLQAATANSNASSNANLAPGEVDVDSILRKLLEVRGSRPGKQVTLAEAEIRYYAYP